MLDTLNSPVQITLAAHESQPVTTLQQGQTGRCCQCVHSLAWQGLASGLSSRYKGPDVTEVPV